MGETLDHQDAASHEEAALLKRTRVHQELGEWVAGQAGWYPPDDFWDGPPAIPEVTTPPSIDSIALQVIKREVELTTA